MIERLCIIGVGLIGGSLARALKQADYCRHVIGCSRRAGHLEEALSLGVIDSYVLDPAAAVAGADMVLVATPLGAMEEIFRDIRPGLSEHAVLTDAGSAKASVVAAARAAFGVLPSGFVPGHPIAGTEKSGVAASFPELFKDRRVILTPTERSSDSSVQRVRAMWEIAGAEVVSMSVSHHDEILAATSHLPHLLAFGLVDALARMEDRAEMFRFAAGGFRDFTRIASGDPTMWHDICMANRDAILGMLRGFQADLDQLADGIQTGDSRLLMEVFTRAKQARDRFAES